MVASATAAALRILPLGDSITHGYNVPGGYRDPLYHMLTNAGYTVDFVGTQTANSVATLPDPDHEGHSGWTISQIDGIILNVFSRIAAPDIILVLIGTNDYGHGDGNGAAGRLEALIENMAVARPSARIIVSNLLKRGEPRDSEIEATFNPRVPEIVARQVALGRLVYFVDLRSAVPLSDMPDSLHPNLAGHTKMAAKWMEAILAANKPVPFLSDQTLVPEQTACRYMVPTNDSLGLSWTAAEGFNDSAWTAGLPAVGWQNPPNSYTNVLRSWVPANTRSVYVRWPFEISPVHRFTRLSLRVKYDDGFVAYLNGVKVAGTNAPAVPQFNSLATALHLQTDLADATEFDLSAYTNLLRTGRNVLAFHAMDANIGTRVFGMMIQPELRSYGYQGSEFTAVSTPRVGAVRLSVRAFAPTRWRLETSPDLKDWTPLTLLSVGAEGQWHEDSPVPLPDNRYYRAFQLADLGVMTGDYFATTNGYVLIHPVRHAALALGWNGLTIRVDPGTNSFTGVPPADLMLFTHGMPDHFAAASIPGQLAEGGRILAPQAVIDELDAGLQAIAVAMTNGAMTVVMGIHVEAVPMYNPGADSLRPRGAGNGYILTIGGRRILIGGDSSDTPEMRALQGIDAAIVNVEAPWMTAEDAAAAVRAFRPGVVYPCHSPRAELERFRSLVGTDLPIEVRVRDW